jgi:hypothetical protein
VSNKADAWGATFGINIDSLNHIARYETNLQRRLNRYFRQLAELKTETLPGRRPRTLVLDTVPSRPLKVGVPHGAAPAAARSPEDGKPAAQPARTASRAAANATRSISGTTGGRSNEQ